MNTATASLNTSPADDGAVLSASELGDFVISYDGVVNTGIQGTNGLLGLDLSAFDRIRLQLLAPVTSGSTARLTLWDDSGSAASQLPLVDGTLDIPLSAFSGLDLTDISSLSLRINGIGPTTTPSLTLLDISAVPEPGTGLLLALGLGALATRRGRRR